MLHPKRPMRRTQLISPWGVGSIVPFPDGESLMIAGLDMWRFGNDPSEFIIKEERLVERLRINELRQPPDYRDPKADGQNGLIAIPAVRFPTWLYCPFCGTMVKSSFYAGQDRCNGHPWDKGRSCAKNRYRPKMIPERFIVVCPEGHVDDFPVMEWVHKNPKNPKNITDNCIIRRSTGGASASLTGVYYECTCGAKRSLGGAMNEGALNKIGYACKGSKPWLGIKEDLEKPCRNLQVKVVQRGGTNVWFGKIISSIYIPVDDNNTKRRLVDIMDEYMEKIINRRVNGEIDEGYIRLLADVKKVSGTELFEAILTRLEKSKEVNRDIDEKNEENEVIEDKYRYEEYKVLSKNSGSDSLFFHSKNKQINEYNESIKCFFKSVSVVPKLKETRALVGFSRLQPEDNRSLEKNKSLLRLGKGEWLPAIEVYGEGIFVEFDDKQVKKWAKTPQILGRIERLVHSYKGTTNCVHDNEEIIRPEFVLIHTFAHLLINQLSFECGYGSSSIRERIYCSKTNDKLDMYGVLIYTASGDSEGSLGGLVRQGYPGKFENTVIAALENARWCSADPICIESTGQGPDSCNLAACYNCALLPETCCENGNRFLDRGVVIGTLDNSNIGYFNYSMDGINR